MTRRALIAVLLLLSSGPACALRDRPAASAPPNDLRELGSLRDLQAAFDGDARETVDRSLLPDPRVVHLWDDGRRAGRFYAAFTRPDDPEWVEWDAFFVYPRGVAWAESATRPAAWGRTVIHKREELRKAVASVLGSRGNSSRDPRRIEREEVEHHHAEAEIGEIDEQDERQVKEEARCP